MDWSECLCCVGIHFWVHQRELFHQGLSFWSFCSCLWVTMVSIRRRHCNRPHRFRIPSGLMDEMATNHAERWCKATSCTRLGFGRNKVQCGSKQSLHKPSSLEMSTSMDLEQVCEAIVDFTPSTCPRDRSQELSILLFRNQLQ